MAWCSNCAESTMFAPEALRAIGITEEEARKASFLKGRGCDKCQHTGYKGRQGLYELLIVDEPIRRMTVDRTSSGEMKNYAMEAQGMRTLLIEGRMAVVAGKTTPDEVLRVSQREDF